MPHKKIFLLFFFSGFILNSYSQVFDSLKSKYNNQTIYRYGSSFLKGSEKLTFKELSKEFLMSDLGIASYTKAKRYRTTSRIFSLTSLASGLVAVAMFGNGRNQNLAAGFLAGQIVLSFGSMRYINLSNQSLDRALWQRNKDLLFPPSQ